MTAAPTSRQQPLTVRVFTQRFSSTPRGARLARHLAQQQLDDWGLPYGADVSARTAAVVAELAANAVTHGHVPGRDFELRLVHTGGTLRVEVSDARGERQPKRPAAVPTAVPTAVSATCDDCDDSGRGLVLVEELADRWSVAERAPVGKTVRAELDLPCPSPRSP